MRNYFFAGKIIDLMRRSMSQWVRIIFQF